MLLRRSWPTKTLLALAAVTVLAGGCQNSQQTGTVLGALGGAAAGYAIGDGKWWAVGAGALVGGLVGNQVGAYLDSRDRQAAYNNANYALSNNADGQTSTWSNPEKGTSGYTTPTNTYQSAGSTCRTYQTGVTAGGQSQSGTGQACRQPDGTWKLVN
ncbi:MAG: glycine zipper 2TM domain-containing protein [Rhodospirillaceae bacterium]|jgi:surface antigen|nr:glycine zipper 2TM domain-containing protein [Rhodospirillaceae bacterium]